jgi:chromate transporter
MSGGERSRASPSLREVAAYFLQLGALGFGGPVALASAMRRDLVDRRGWLTEAEYDSGLAIAAACPGPLAYQLGVYAGFLRQGLAGALAAAIAFGLVPFVLVVGMAALYTRLGDAWALRAVFYGVGPVVVALIVKGGWTLGRRTLRRDTAAWTVAVAAAVVTAVLERELTVLFLAAGVLGIAIFAPPSPTRPTPEAARPPLTGGGAALPLGLVAAAAPGTAGQLFLFFFKTGCLVFGSGLVIVPFLKTYVVDQYHWMGNREFLDAVAIGMISPGPVVITATFVGYRVAGLAGAAAATLGIFSPAVLFTVAATPLLLRHGSNRRLQGFVRGVTVSVVGVLAGTTVLVARAAIGDALTAAIAAASLAVLAAPWKVPEPFVVLAGALIGLGTRAAAG